MLTWTVSRDAQFRYELQRLRISAAMALYLVREIALSRQIVICELCELRFDRMTNALETRRLSVV